MTPAPPPLRGPPLGRQQVRLCVYVYVCVCVSPL